MIGGGVVGLSVARELASRGVRVTLVEREAARPEARGGAATWASMGVLTAPTAGKSSLQRLQSLGHRTYPALARALEDETGIDVGYRVPGSLHLKSELPPSPVRAKLERRYHGAGLSARWIDEEELRGRYPAIAGRFRAALHVEEEALVNPRALGSALRSSCERRGVVFREGAGEARVHGTHVSEVHLEDGERISGAVVIVTAGAWSRRVLAGGDGPELPVRPIRGQVVEVASTWPEGPNLRYESAALRREYHIVARESGLAWIGSTVEDVGFDPSVTEAGIEELFTAAREVFPEIERGRLTRAFSGLRPQALRPGGPFVGRLPGRADIWVDTGHYRSGILTGPASAVLLVEEMLGEATPGERISGEQNTPGGRELGGRGLGAFRVER